MTDLLDEQRISLTALSQELGVHVSTVWRWVLRGLRGHHLECVRIGGRRYTTREAFARFIAATNGQRLPTPDKQRTAEVDRAEEELDDLLGGQGGCDEE